MGSTVGDFGSSPNHLQCTAKSKRSGERCKGVAVATSATQKCRMHGGTAAVGANASGFKTGRSSKYLPADMARIYEEAISNPDILEMADHIGLLEARIHHILKQWADSGDSVPRWSEVKAWFDELLTAFFSEKRDEFINRLQTLTERLTAGTKWDSMWDQIQDTMEQLRKMADTEIKRKKELNQMVPIERVIALMGAVGMAVKRNVKDPNQIAAVESELRMLYAGNTVPDMPRVLRVGATVEVDADVIDIPALTE